MGQAGAGWSASRYLSTSACSFLGVCPDSTWITPVTPQHHPGYRLATDAGTTRALCSLALALILAGLTD